MPTSRESWGWEDGHGTSGLAWACGLGASSPGESGMLWCPRGSLRRMVSIFLFLLLTVLIFIVFFLILLFLLFITHFLIFLILILILLGICLFGTVLLIPSILRKECNVSTGCC